MANRSNYASLVGRPMSLATVFDELQTVPVRELKQFIHFTRPASEMDRDDRSCARSQRSPHGFGRNILTIAINICHHRPPANRDGATG